MQLLFLGIVFIVMLVLLAAKRPLWQAITGGLLAIALLYRIHPVTVLERASLALTKWDNLSVLLSFYVMAYLQRMLEARKQIQYAQNDLNRLFHNRRINATVAPIFIGLLPSAAAMILCGDIVKEATDGYLDPVEQAVATSWFRHVPESILPTYASVLLMHNLSGVPISGIMLGMLVPAAAIFALGYIFFIRRIPRDPGTERSDARARDALNLIRHLWPLPATLILILAFKINVVFAVLIVIGLCALIYRFSPRELLPMVRSAFEVKLLLNTLLVLALKELIAYTGVLELLPATLAALPIPEYAIFALMFFLGGIISGNTSIVAIGTPIAFATIPSGGMKLAALLMCMAHASNQLSPTHVCLVVASDYYKVELGSMIRKSILMTLLFGALMLGYYRLLLLF